LHEISKRLKIFEKIFQDAPKRDGLLFNRGKNRAWRDFRTAYSLYSVHPMRAV